MSGFFDHPQGAAILKHKTLATYAKLYAQKTGSASSGRQVVFLDGYAGPGRYADESPGSPQLLVDTAHELAEVRNVQCLFVEQDPSHFERLQQLLRDLGAPAQAYLGNVEDHLSRLVQQAADAPLLVFLDPFGLAIPFQQLVRTLLHRPTWTGGRPISTEVIINFSVNGLQRAAGRLDEQPIRADIERARHTRIAGLDAFLDGDWWRELWKTSHGADRVDRILNAYLRRLREAAPGWRSLSVPVRDDPDRSVVSYHLVMLTRHPQGEWFFANAASHGAQALRDYYEKEEGRLYLLPPNEMDHWTQRLERNILQLLLEQPTVQVGQHTREVYGDLLGLARETHVRSALKRLHERGMLADAPTGDLYKYSARRGPAMAA